MVDEHLIFEIRKAFGQHSPKILVTGATGFLGSHLARDLAEAGLSVTATGRNPYTTSRIIHPAIRICRADLDQSQLLSELISQHDLIFHCAAMSKPWGKKADFDRVNVEGSWNIAQACYEHKKRLIHVSSTSIFFDFKNRTNIRDSDSLPTRPCCTYAASKREAEEVIKNFTSRGLNGVIVRARAIFGPGDAAIFPRILLAAQMGRLRQIGNGQNLIDLTYIDNMVLAIILAGLRGKTGLIATLTNREATALWPVIETALQAVGISKKLRVIPYRVAYAAAFAFEKIHVMTRKPGEPALTRYGVGILSKTQTFDTVDASKEIGYVPLISVSEGLKRTLNALREKNNGHSKTIVKLRLFTTGFTKASAHLVDVSAPRMIEIYHASFALIEHSKHGLILFDTGYSTRFYDETVTFPSSLYGRFAPAYTHEKLSAIEILKRNGISGDQINRVIISHFHADHIGGLRDFDRADFIAGPGAYDDVRNRRGFSAIRRAYLAGLMPNDSGKRIFQIEQFQDPGIGAFDHTHDLFGDGSIRLVQLPGHTKGQIGALLQTGPDSRSFLIADAVYTHASIDKFSMPHRVTSLFIDSRKNLRATLQKLHRLKSDFPDIELIPCHSPEIAARYGFADQIMQVCPGLIRMNDSGRTR